MTTSGPAWLNTPPPDATPMPRRRWLLGCAGLIVALVILAAMVFYLFSRALGNGFAVVSASGGQIDGFHAFSNGPVMSITFQAARGMDLPDGPRLACDVVRPALAPTDWAHASWTIVNRAGDVIASDETPCP